MKLENQKNGHELTVKISGRITSDNAHQLTDYMAGLDYSSMDLVMDFSEVEYITSAGLRALIIARKSKQTGRMRLRNVNKAVYGIFETVGFLDLLDIERTEDAEQLSDDPSFRQLLSYRVKTSPDKEIFFIDDQAYTWRDVDRCSQIIADDLCRIGVHKGSHVGIMGSNSINWVFTFYAVQKLGGIVVLLNFSLKPGEIVTSSRIGDITHLCIGDIHFADSKDAFIREVTSEASRIRYVYDIHSAINFMERYSELPALAGRFEEPFDADDPSMMIFTSGTTGKPKGVLSSSHDRITNCRSMYREMHCDERDRICMFLPLCHVFGFGTGFSVALLLNIPLHMPSSTRDEVLLDTIEKYRCTIFNSVPTKIISMTHHPRFSAERVSSLRVSLIGGAPITAAQLSELRQKMPDVHFMPIYGMSEVSPISIVKYEDTFQHITETVGKPVDEVQVEIRNTVTGSICPADTEGEIYVKSDTSLVCYYKLDLKSQILDMDGWIPTGDLGRLDSSGYLYISGRIKDLIIRGGENISPGEIASAISETGDVTDVKVIGIPDPLFGEVVGAALIMKHGKTFDREKMNAFLSARLSRYKLPAYYFVYDSFPLLANGKIDMLRLKKDAAERAAQEGSE